jgi:iron complex outermembrane receptor protein
VTLDAYRIDIDDRIGLSSAFELTNAQREQLLAIDVPLAAELTHVRFYSNSFDTRTTGVDLVTSWRTNAGPGQLGLTIAGNWNKAEFRRYNPTFFDEPTRVAFLDNLPNVSATLSTDYEVGAFRLSVRARHYGDWVYVANTSATTPVYEDIGRETFFDVIGNYEVSESMYVTLGVENLLNNFTQTVGLVTIRNNGRLYPGGSPYENDGRQVYARFGITFK